jgi:uncharacterized protein YndB with AHSA1/START domain
MRFFLTVCLLLLSSVSVAEVVDQAPGGFTSRSVHVVVASPDQVWAGLTNDIGQWWHPDHTWSGDAANLYLDGKAGEEFGEKLPGGGTVTHMEVVYADKGKMLRLRGSLGPLQAMAVVGVLTVEMAAVEAGTQLTVTYAVGGYGVEGLAGPVDGVIVEQFERLVAYLVP